MIVDKRKTKEGLLSKCLETLGRQSQWVTLADNTTSQDEPQLGVSDVAEISRGILDKEDLGLLCALERTQYREEEVSQGIYCQQGSNVSTLERCKSEEASTVRNRSPSGKTETRGSVSCQHVGIVDEEVSSCVSQSD